MNKFKVFVMVGVVGGFAGYGLADVVDGAFAVYDLGWSLPYQTAAALAMGCFAGWAFAWVRSNDR